MLVSKGTAGALAILLLFASVSFGAAIGGALGFPHEYLKSNEAPTTPTEFPVAHASEGVEVVQLESDGRQQEGNPIMRADGSEGKEQRSAAIEAPQGNLKTSAKRRCIRDYPVPDANLHDAYETYRLSLVASAAAREELRDDEDAGQTLLELPEHCSFMERQKLNVLCNGSEIDSIPQFNFARHINNLHFNATSIKSVNFEDSLPRSLKSLYFSNGVLHSFNGAKLGSVSDLELLGLDYNAIERWSFAKSFDSSTAGFQPSTIRTIDLSHNRISYPPDPWGNDESVLPFLETVVLSHNPLRNLPSKLFHPLRNSSVIRLYLKNCSIAQFNEPPLSHFPQLEVLDLSLNQAINTTELRQMLEGLLHLRELYLSYNNYQEVPTAALMEVNATLEVLDLHSSAFNWLDNSSFPDMPKLLRLNLMNCRISSIPLNTFDGLPVLQELNLDQNNLMTIPSEALLPSLQKLTLNQNPFSCEHPFIMDGVSFRGMVNLKNVTLDKVDLGRIKSSYFNDLHNLEELSLYDCGITSVDCFSFRNLSKLRRLHLNNNNIKTLQKHSLSGLENLEYLDLSDNSLKVTLEMKSGLGAASPLAAALSRLGMQGEDKEAVYSPDDCDSQQVTQPFSELVSLRTLNLSKNRIRYLLPELFENLSSLSYLDLNSNRINSWEKPVLMPLPNLSDLYLQGNSLDTINDAMEADLSKDSLKVVDLARNPFTCDCNIKKFNNTLNTANFVEWPYHCMDESDYIPMDDFLVKMNGVQCSDEQSSSTVVIITSAIISGLLLVTSVIVYRKRWYVRYFVYTLRMRTKEFIEDTDKYCYDTFVCYSQTDRQWVFEHLVAKLEDGGRYRVCIHERDFTVGHEITDNIISSVERSRKVVVVLSPSFIRSSWCMFELQMASNKILDERKSKLIILLLERIPEEDQPKKLKLLLKTRTYLEWSPNIESQKLFWARLLRAIAKPSDSEVVAASTKL